MGAVREALWSIRNGPRAMVKTCGRSFALPSVRSSRQSCHIGDEEMLKVVGLRSDQRAMRIW